MLGEMSVENLEVSEPWDEVGRRREADDSS